MDGLQVVTSLLTGLVAAIASLTIIKTWRLKSMLKGSGPWLYFTAAIVLSMASVYCLLLLPVAGFGQLSCVVLCYPLLGCSAVCYRRWLEIISRFIPKAKLGASA